jgi:S-(hydroxymethyl)glutathione dehydrogenase/alcohol dehydrogenase
MAASGVCHSDLHTLDGIQPFALPVILGHEGAGVVEAVGPEVTGVRAGDHVMLSWVPYCGRCRMCAQGRPSLCEDLAWSDAGTMMDGTVRFHADGAPVHHYTTSSFSGLSVVPAQSCIPVASDLPLDELALMGCAVMTGFGAVFNTAGVRPGDRVAVIGCGGVGLAGIAVLRARGITNIVACDIDPAKLETARKLGAKESIDTRSPETAQQLLGIAGAIDFVGMPATAALGLAALRKGGRYVLVGLHGGELVHPLPPIAQRAIGIVGSYVGNLQELKAVVALAKKKKLKALPVETRPASAANAALEDLKGGRVAGRVVLDFEASVEVNP